MLEITLDDVLQIQEDDELLKQLCKVVEQVYHLLSQMCNHAPPDPTDDDEEEELDEDDKNIRSLSKALALSMSKSTDLVPDDYNFDDGFDPLADANKEKIIYNGEVSTEDEPDIPMEQILKMIRQASHPDKLLKFSAVDKAKIIECFHEAKQCYEEGEYPALVLCYVKVFVLRNEPRRITFQIWKYVKQRHREIIAHIRYIRQKPYMKAIELYQRGDVDGAVRLFKQYLETGGTDPMDDLDCF